MADLENTQTMNKSTMEEQSPGWLAVVLGGLAALAFGLAGNALLYLVADALGAIPETVLAPTRPITLIPIVILTVFGTIGGTLLYGLLLRWARQPLRTWGITAVVLLVLAVIPTLTIGAPVEMIISLNLMHLVVAGSLWRSLRRL